MAGLAKARVEHLPDRGHMHATPTTPHGPIWRGASVLVVDDEPAMRRILRRALEAEEFHVEEAPDGESALTRSIAP